MSMHSPRLIGSVLLLSAATCLLSVATLAEQGPRLGVELSAEELERAELTVMPDGDGLPSGSGSASTGSVIYTTNCMACHGERGTGGINDTLVGGHGTLTSSRPQKTIGSYWPYATTLFDYVRRAMPYQTPGSLSNDEVYAVTAYLLFLNDVIEEDLVLNADTLPRVEMPNRDGFIWAYSP